ncbi:DNA-binding protein [Paraburkholderia sp. J11-2]|uniref:DNA-binding protein n=1 Tax=Paraburkholderia sp. J11-2 TaxID=2805431 RepID=UPI002AB79081|nr:DNA-binding protein [Paraburkholderia sp. J11-2]
MTDVAPDEVRLAAEIERLKAEFPKTRELYREVCALMFFRYGITPTANRLYQLVRRGSMSTPTAVLSEFWATLREKSRVRIEHADLPEELQGAAGELMGALWTRATAAAQASLDALRLEVEEARRAAEGATAAVRADLGHTEVALEQRTAALLTAQVRIQELEQAQAGAVATRGALEAELAREREASRERDTAQTQARAEFAAERDKLRASAELAQAGAQRALRAEESARAEIQALQAQVGDLRHQVGMLEGRLDALRSTREVSVRERQNAPAKPLRAARKTGPKT